MRSPHPLESKAGKGRLPAFGTDLGRDGFCAARQAWAGQETDSSMKHGDGGNPSLGCSANDRRSQFPRFSGALHDIKTDLDRRKKFLPVTAGKILPAFSRPGFTSFVFRLIFVTHLVLWRWNLSLHRELNAGPCGRGTD